MVMSGTKTYQGLIFPVFDSFGFTGLERGLFLKRFRFESK
jgi:hypothetical protein